jgi:hypothetical protein
LDDDFTSVAAAHSTHILTRNRHADDIQSFLAAHGVGIAGLCITPKGASKADYVEAVLAAAGPGATALFADDSLAEVCDPRLAADPRVRRVLFLRGRG